MSPRVSWADIEPLSLGRLSCDGAFQGCAVEKKLVVKCVSKDTIRHDVFPLYRLGTAA